MQAISEKQHSPTKTKLQAKTAHSLPSTDIFANLIGGPDLHVPDWLIYKLIRISGRKINGLAEFQIYVNFILDRSCGHINRPQWHSAQIICEIIGISERQLRRLEQSWVQDGWLIKVDHVGVTTERVLGHRFNDIRSKGITVFEGGVIGPGGEDRTVRGGRTELSGGGGQNCPPNPNEFNPNDFNPNKIPQHSSRAYDQTNKLDKKTASLRKELEGMALGSEDHVNKGKEWSVILKQEYGITSQPSLLTRCFGLIELNFQRDLSWLDRMRDEILFYVASQKDPFKDPAMTVYNYVKNYREPRATQTPIEAVKTKTDTETPEARKKRIAAQIAEIHANARKQ